MAHINRRFIDKHWFVFVLRGGIAAIFGFMALFGGLVDLEETIATISIFLLGMGIMDSISVLYSVSKKRGWINSVIDAMIDVAAALALLFLARGSVVSGVVILAIYTCASGIVDVFHGFLSTVDPTDRFIRILAGIIGTVMGFVILNAGPFEMMTFIRFFGAYMLIVGVTSLIYGVHNRSQDVEDSVARSETAKKIVRGKSVNKKKASKKAPAKKPTTKKSSAKKK